MQSGDDFNDPALLELLQSTLDDFDKVSSTSSTVTAPQSTPTSSATNEKDSSSKKAAVTSKNQSKKPSSSKSSAPSEEALFQEFLQQMQNNAGLGPGEEENISELLNMMEHSMRDLMKEVSKSPQDAEAPKASPVPSSETQDAQSSSRKRKKPDTTESTDANEAVVLERLKRLTEELPNMEERARFLSGNADMPGDTADPSNVLGGFLQNMLRQLLDRDLIYPSLKPICDRYPLWLEENRDSLSAEELSHRQKQAAELIRVCELYETNAEAWTQHNVTEAHLFQIMEHIESAMRNGPPPEALLQSGEENPDEDSVEQQEQLQRLFQHAAQSGGAAPEQCSLM